MDFKALIGYPLEASVRSFFMQLVSCLAWQSHVISKRVLVLNTFINETWCTQNVKLNTSIERYHSFSSQWLFTVLPEL